MASSPHTRDNRQETKMSKVGILVSGRDYYVPYLEWFLSACNVSSILANSQAVFSSIDANFVNDLSDVISSSDVVISLGYWKILSKQVIESVPLGIVNLHNSYRLQYRGRHMCTWAIQNGEQYHGSTIHYVNENLDDGPIIVTEKVPIDRDDTAESLMDKVNTLGLELFKRAMPDILNNSVVTSNPNPNHFSYKEADLDHEISVQTLHNPDKLYNMVRSLTFKGKPKPYTVIQGRRIYLELEQGESDD